MKTTKRYLVKLKSTGSYIGDETGEPLKFNSEEQARKCLGVSDENSMYEIEECNTITIDELARMLGMLEDWGK